MQYAFLDQFYSVFHHIVWGMGVGLLEGEGLVQRESDFLKQLWKMLLGTQEGRCIIYGFEKKRSISYKQSSASWAF